MIYEDENGGRHGDFARAIADSTVFWWNERKPNQLSLWENKIELGEKFFNEIIQSSLYRST